MTINTLKGVKSCHTGINRTVGWNVPVGYLVETGHLSVMGCDVLKGENFRTSLKPAPLSVSLSVCLTVSVSFCLSLTPSVHSHTYIYMNGTWYVH